MKFIKYLLSFFVLSNIIFNISFAQNAQPNGPVASNCGPEIQKFCKDKEHGHGEVRACLEAHKAEVSQTCKDALEHTGGGRKYNQNQP